MSISHFFISGYREKKNMGYTDWCSVLPTLQKILEWNRTAVNSN